MSVIRPVLLNCDGCGEVSENQVGTTFSVIEARRATRRRGWTHKGPHDLCRACTAGVQVGRPVREENDGSLWACHGTNQYREVRWNGERYEEVKS